MITDDTQMSTKLVDLVTQLADRTNADLYVYSGDIGASGYACVSGILDDATRRGARRKNTALFLNTYGGNAHAAYRMARAFGHHYDHLTLYVFGPCKSAGTLMALGFNEIVIGDRGELGPMDVQMASKEELYEYNSGLDMIQAMEFLQRHAKATFHSFLHDIRTNTGLATKSAGEMARQLTQGLFGSMYSQLEPVRLGHVQRTMSVAHAYGRRLVSRSESLKNKQALDDLVYSYPCHEFVIDRKEAKQNLFAENVVRCPTEEEAFIGDLLTQLFPAAQTETEFHSLHQALSDVTAAVQKDLKEADKARPAAAESPRKPRKPRKPVAK